MLALGALAYLERFCWPFASGIFNDAALGGATFLADVCRKVVNNEEDCTRLPSCFLHSMCQVARVSGPRVRGVDFVAWQSVAGSFAAAVVCLKRFQHCTCIALVGWPGAKVFFYKYFWIATPSWTLKWTFKLCVA